MHDPVYNVRRSSQRGASSFKNMHGNVAAGIDFTSMRGNNIHVLITQLIPLSPCNWNFYTILGTIVGNS